MSRQRAVDDLSEDELRGLLMEKRRAGHEARLEAFRRSGRIIQVEPDEGVRATFSGYEEEEYTPPRRRTLKRRRGGLDRTLFLVEIAAVVGLLFIIFNGVNLLKNLNQQSTAALVLPTAAPTPLITAVILPGGHVAPVAGEENRFNEAEIPEHLRPLFAQGLINPPAATPSPQQARQVQIPAIGVNAPIVQGDDWEQLKMGAGQHIGSTNPGEAGNLVLSAHNDIYGEIFRYLDRLKEGDEVVIITQDRSFTYEVIAIEIVDPTRVDLLAPTNDSTITLISCYPDLVDNKRIVVQGLLRVN